MKLASLGPSEMMAFSGTWKPGDPLADGKPSPWHSWREYLRDWRAVRDEVEARQDEFGKTIEHWFAEWVFQNYGLNGPTSSRATRQIRYSPFDSLKKRPRYLVDYWIHTGYFTEVEVGGGGPFYVDAVTLYAMSVAGPQQLTDGRIVRLKGDQRDVVPHESRR